MDLEKDNILVTDESNNDEIEDTQTNNLIN